MTIGSIGTQLFRSRAYVSVNKSRLLGITRCFSASSNDTSDGNLVGWRISDKDDRIGILTLQSSRTYNALTVEMGREFSDMVRHLIQNVISVRDLRAIILTGEGNNAFSAGGDLDWLRSLKSNSVHANADLMISFYNSFLCIRQVPIPVIAAMNGPAMGAGAGLALACDLRVGVSTPKLLGLNFTKLGIHSGMGGSYFLKLALPATTAANEILLMGKTLSGQESLDLGLINRLVPGSSDNNSSSNNSTNAVDVALEMGMELAQQHPVALRMMVQTLRSQQDVGLQQALQREAIAQATCYNRADWGEGVNAVAEKRDPQFDEYFDK
ncbi:hypothetical protein ACA910_020448 [Epithemia clementina (nom. ined.)]